MNEALRQELVRLLREGTREDALESLTLDSHLQRGGSLVLFGAGSLGRRLLATARAHSIPVAAFADNNPKLWNSEIEGVPVLSPEIAAQRFADEAAFVVALWHPCEHSHVCSAARQLRSLGCKKVVTFPHFQWRYAKELLPNFFWSTRSSLLSEPAAIIRTFELLADERSQCAYVAAIRLRLLADFSATDNVAEGAQYFPPDLYRPSDQECFVDCGAFDGDSLREFVEQTRGNFRSIVAFEADPANAVLLRACVEQLGIGDKVEVRSEAVAGENGRVRFTGDGKASAAICESGGIDVACVTLDSALREKSVTILKMDIEGGESDALRGAAEIISKQRPVLAICVYHRPQDLWTIPQQMAELMPNANIHLRSHRADGFDLVCYAIPKERASAQRRAEP